MSHNFRSRYARKSIKGSIHPDFDLVFNKTLSSKIAHWVGAQGQAKMAKITQKQPCGVPTGKAQIQNKKFFFSIFFIAKLGKKSGARGTKRVPIRLSKF